MMMVTVYISDEMESTVRKYDKDGNFLMKFGSYGNGDGQFTFLYGMVLDGKGYIYVSDSFNNCIQKFDTNGNFVKKWGRSGTGNGQFNSAHGMAIDKEGNIYVADSDNNRVQVFDEEGNFLRKWGEKGLEEGNFKSPLVIGVDSEGNVYVGESSNRTLKESNHRLQKFTSDGIFISKWGNSGLDVGELYYPADVKLDKNGNIYVADVGNSRIQKFNSDRKFMTSWKLEGNDSFEFSMAFNIDVAEDGTVYVINSTNSSVQKFDSDGSLIKKWGSNGSEDGQFNNASGITLDSDENVYVTDTSNKRIQKFTSDGELIKIYEGKERVDGKYQSFDKIQVDSNGDMYILNSSYGIIEKYDSEGEFIGEWGSSGRNDGEFIFPVAIKLDGKGNIYVADSHNNRIQKITTDGNFIEKWGSVGSDDNQFNKPYGIDIDSNGNIYVADKDNHRIQILENSGPTKYTVTFNSIGGSAVSDINDITEGSKISEPASPTKDGFTFAGWYKDSRYTTKWNFDEDTVNENITLYARWTEQPSVVVPKVLTSNASNIKSTSAKVPGIVENDGNGTITEIGVVYGKNANPVIGTDNVTTSSSTKVGMFSVQLTGLEEETMYYARAYATNEAGTGYGKEISFETIDEKPTTYTVTFNSIGGSAVSDINDITEGSKISEPASPTKDGFTFAGWYKDSRYTTKWNFDEDTVNENITLYARWTEQPLVVVPKVVTSNASNIKSTSAKVPGIVENDGNGTITEIGVVYGKNANPVIGTDNVTTSSSTKVGMFSVQLTGLEEETTYYARAYATNEAGTGYGKEISFETISETSTKYTVTFNSIGGSAVSDINDITEGSKISEPASPTKGSFTFAGWYKDSRYTTKWNFDEDTVNENITLYARWTEQPLVVVPTVVTSGAATSINITSARVSGNVTNNGNGTITEIGIVYGKNANPVIGTDNVTTSSATTVGEFTVSLTGLKAETTYHARAYAINEAGTGYGNDMTFTTNSKPIPTYTVKFDSQGGSAVLDIENVTEGSTVSEPVAPTRNKYTFNGWYKELNGVNKWNFKVDTVTMNITLYGKWTRIPRDSDSGRSSSSGDSTSSNSDNKNQETGIKVIVNGEVQTAGKEIVKEEKGRKEVELVVDADVVNKKIEEIIKSQLGMTDENKKEANNIIEVPVSNENADKITTTLTGDMIKNMDENHFKLVVKVKGIDYIIPAKEVKIEDVAKTLGIKEESLKEINVEVKIEKSDALVSEGMEKTAKQNNYEIVVSPVDFKVVAKTTSNDGKENQVEVSRFNKYVERVMEIPESTDPNKITTGIVYNSDGSFSHVPTSVYNNNKAYFARINSLTNSNYSVIWNPIEVKSVENHWAKESVNDMASRLIVFDPEEFNPDDSITRADFAEYIVRALGLYRKDGDHENNFSDVDMSDERAIGILTANEYGIVTGYPDGTFKPNGKISREEAMVMYQRAMNITELVGEDSLRYENYTDYETVSDWAQSNVKAVLSAHVFNGKNETAIEPKLDLTYAEAAEAIRNLLVESELINE